MPEVSKILTRKWWTRRSSSASSSSSDSGFDPRRATRPSDALNAPIAYSPEYGLGISLFVVTIAHLILCFIVTLILCTQLPSAADPNPPDSPSPWPEGRKREAKRAVLLWATFLGIASSLLACAQYIPQLVSILSHQD